MTKITILLLMCFGISEVLCFPSLASVSNPYQPNEPLDITGEHAYQPPGPTDQRGPCPGLNALANHGYINRNGISTPLQAFEACLRVGIASDVAAVLTALAVVAGNGLVFSIGNGSLTTGIGFNTHNFLEGDTSYKSSDCASKPTPTGCDNFSFNDTAWSTTYNASRLYDNLFNISTFVISAKKRYDESVTNNPQCFFGPMQFVFHYVTPSVFAHIFPNGTDGKATEMIENTWIGIETNANGERSGVPGGGRIPDNWFPRQQPFNQVELSEDLLQIYLAHPVLLGACINGTFIPGTLQLPLQPTAKDMMCFIYKAISSAASVVTLPVVAAYLDPVFVNGSWGCPLFSTGR